MNQNVRLVDGLEIFETNILRSVSPVNRVDESNSARVLIGCKPIMYNARLRPLLECRESNETSVGNAL